MTVIPARAGGPAGIVTDYPRDATLHEVFGAVAARGPHAPAVRWHERELSYGELDERSRALAARLRRAGVRVGDLVGVCGRRSPEAIIAFLGVLRAGAAYVPLDDHTPPARLNAMAEDAGIRAAVVLPGARCRVRRLGIRIDLAHDDDGPVPEPDGRAPGTGRQEEAGTGAAGCAYVMFTSGTTGRPKPVAVPHRGVMRLALSDPDLPRPGPADRVLHGYGLSSDASTIEIWSGLLGGACLVIADREELLSPYALERRLRDDGVTIAYLTTSVFHHVARTRPHALADLRFVSAGGEAMDPALAREVLRACPATEVANLYGPTENTVVSTVHFVRGLPEDARTVPIGRPLANSTCRVLLPDGSPAPPGEEGELYVGGDGLALGYLGDPKLTAERFVTFDDGERLYRTGDRARMNGEGALEYLGRLDRQLKLRGQRIEPDEAEARLRDHPSVGEAVVEVDADGQGLVAYLTPAVPGRPVDTAALRRFCALWLPAPAVPRVIHQVAAFPMTPGGKVDRARLAAEAREHASRAPALASGHDSGLRELVASAWEAALGVRPEPRDDFFLIGGDSLLAAEVVNRTRAVLGLDAAHGSRLIRALLDAPTVEGFAGAVADALAGASGPGTAVDFEAEARLGFTLPSASGPSPRPRDPRDVLLTGATGFVGAFLLDRLLRRTGARVHCPVRARDTAHARRRVLATLDRYGLSPGDREDRLVCFPGDLAEPELGLDPAHRHELERRLDLIVHSGARVNFIYPYTALRGPNVEGTRALIRLAAPRRVPLHFLSTVAVLAGFGTAGTRHVDEDVPLAHADRLTMGYAESKWVAERVLREAARQGLPVAVYRPYEVTGDRSSGVCNTETAICSLFKMIAETGFAPDIALPMDFVPVDHVADAIVRIATGRTTASETYHLTNPRPATLADVVERMRAAGFEIETLPYARWVGELIKHVTADPTSPTAPFVSLCVDRGKGADISVKEMYVSDVFPGLGRRNTEAALAGSGLTCPPVDTALIDHYLEHLFASGFIRRPRAKGRAT
ncbi:amino acid adenylation domain-containing protein [Bailinhaonella thermotolerans]|uniref:Amino acid adenylation domain-containing protein n=1 Tax=Bailinhaonella thermotolerans TaxID=1070861 RepID=A0A3A4B242_9ACTN|nr:amino acid adenylation domain-containing protein [Bailinhaonella thermotolerans]RJL35805.1 amino acid adenylation domain-containing protein [Bailinhaonella thermotolerans]